MKMNKFLLPIMRKFLEPNYRTMSRSVQKESQSGQKDPTKPSVVSRKAKEHQERITLIGTDNSISIMELASAQNLSARRDLKLVKIEDVNVKTRRPIYKLMTNAQYYLEELQKRKEKKVERQSLSKGDKLVTISAKIAQHDVMTRIKQIVKWLNKQHEVRIVITGDKEGEMKASEEIYSIFEANVKEHGKIVQKRVKGNSLRFQILPLAKETDEISTNDNSNMSKPTNGQAPL